MDNEPVAPAAPQVPSEATPSTSNSAPAPAEGNPTPQLSAEDVAKYIGTTSEGLEEMMNFYKANGGPDKALKKVKSAISNPQPKTPAEPTAPAQTQPVTPMSEPAPQQPAPVKPAEGQLTPEEFMTREYFRSMAKEDAYQNIAEEMKNGEILKQLANFDIKPVVNGNFNDAKVRQFLDMYSKTKPAVQTTAPQTSTPTVEYTEVTGEITSQDQALMVIQQSARMKAAGKGEHPAYAKAKEFMTNSYRARHPEPNAGRSAGSTAPSQQ